METAVRGNTHAQSSSIYRTTILQFVNHVNLDPNKLDCDTLYSAPFFAQKHIENHQKLSEGSQDAREINFLAQ